jgi:phosphatidate cytidylyltransferase
VPSPPDTDPPGASRALRIAEKWRDLRPRVLTALALIPVAAVPLAVGGWSAALFVALVAAAMGWEFRRMVAAPAPVADHAAFAAALAAPALLAGTGATTAAAFLLALAAAGFALRDAVAGRPWFWGPAGVAALGGAAAAFAALRADPVDGLNLVLWIAMVVVATDTGAYFAGRILGGPRLWPRVSPKKTWAGLLGGVALAALAGAAFAALTARAPAPQVAAISALAAIVAQGGDLAESALKRRFGVKDSSALLPGHGGVLDRLDGFCAVALAAAAATFARGVPVFAW